MKFTKIFIAATGLLVLSVSALWPGDSAFFVDLGFSQDGSHYMFGQYGVQADTLKPWADLFIVDVAKNNFVSGGRNSYTHDRPIDPGQDGAGALYRLIARNVSLAERYGVTYLSQGQPLYVSLEGDPAYSGETITFRDFVSGASYRANLVETISGSGSGLASRFYINLECTGGDGSHRSFRVGTPDFSRPLISSYRIKKALIAPSGNAIIFVIEMKRQSTGGHDIRYMVEALRF
jgi:predicted secreted protein